MNTRLSTTRRRACGMLLAGIAAAGLSSAAIAENRFVFANTSAYDTLDPHQVFDVGRVAVRLNLYDGLYRWEDNPPKIQPWLAEGYTVSDDGLKWTFTLKPGSKFHDWLGGDRGRRRLLDGTHSRPQAGRRRAVLAHDRARELPRRRRLHGRVHPHRAVGHLPVHRARDPRGERRFSSVRTRRTATGARRGSAATTRAPAPSCSRTTTPRSASAPPASRTISSGGGRSTSTPSSSGACPRSTPGCSGCCAGTSTEPAATCPRTR